MFETIKNFFKGLFDSEGHVSSKRVVGFGAFLLIAAIIIVALAKGVIIPEFMWYGLLGLIATCFGLNTFLSNKSMDIKSQVATDLVDKEPEPDTADAAKDVLNSSKP